MKWTASGKWNISTTYLKLEQNIHHLFIKEGKIRVRKYYDHSLPGFFFIICRVKEKVFIQSAPLYYKREYLRWWGCCKGVNRENLSLPNVTQGRGLKYIGKNAQAPLTRRLLGTPEVLGVNTSISCCANRLTYVH